MSCSCSRWLTACQNVSEWLSRHTLIHMHKHSLSFSISVTPLHRSSLSHVPRHLSIILSDVIISTWLYAALKSLIMLSLTSCSALQANLSHFASLQNSVLWFLLSLCCFKEIRQILLSVSNSLWHYHVLLACNHCEWDLHILVAQGQKNQTHSMFSCNPEPGSIIWFSSTSWFLPPSPSFLFSMRGVISIL